MDRLPLSGLETFQAIAEHGTLRRAAAALGVHPPAISHRLKSLEERLGVTLFSRTTRSVRLTDAGRALLGRTTQALRDLGDALEEARTIGSTRKGTLRITLPYVAFELAIAPRLAAFQGAYPDIELDLSFDEAFVDVVAQGLHAGVRMGDHIQEDMVAVRLTPPFKEAFFAAPSYLARRGRPRSPSDLLHHTCIRYRFIGARRIADWHFQGDRGPVSVAVRGGLIVNSTQAVVRAARAGLGIGWLYRPNVEGDLASGTLESVLDGAVLERPGFFLYFPRAHHRLEILRIFIAFMKP
jgi:DNA-binding transcriptional LysR family regulator